MNRRYGIYILALVGILTACRSSKEASRSTPNTQVLLDVKPTAQLQTERVRGNSLLTVEYHWTTGPDFTPPDNNLRAKVHFTDESGTIYWQDDHVVTPDPRTWKQGHDYHYRRVIYVPLIPRVTQIFMLAGLYDPEKKYPLYKLKGQAFGKDKFIVAGFTVSPPRRVEDLPGHGIEYGEGWYDLETDSGGATSWRWMKKKAVCRLANPHREARLFINGWVPSSIFRHPSTLKVYLGGRELGTYTDLEDQFNILISIPEESFDGKDKVVLELVSDQEYIPSEVKGGSDDRHLAIMVKTLYFH